VTGIADRGDQIRAMNACRLLAVCPQYWPDSQPRSLLATSLTREMAELVHTVTVVTRQVIDYWPGQFRLGRVEVVRLEQRKPRLIDSVRNLGRRDPWLRELGRWLLAHCRQFDLAVVVSGDEHLPELEDMLSRRGLRTLIRVEDLPGLVAQSSIAARQSLARWITPFDCADRPPGSVVIADGGDSRIQAIDQREALRAALGNSHPMLEIPGDGPLAVCSAPLERSHGVFELVSAWKALLNQHPAARLWLIGDGPDGYPLFQHIRDLAIGHACILPGSFDHAGDLITAADGLVVPSRSMRADYLVQTAIRHGLPLICHAANRGVLAARTTCQPENVPCPIEPPQFWTFSEPELPLASVLGKWSELQAEQRNRVGTPPPSRHGSMQEMALRYIRLGQTMLSLPGVC
jgi:glycosyltransferase involved in cell wall biosynthesis